MAILEYFGRTTRFLLGAAIVATVASAVLVVSGGAPVVTFGATAIALAMLASLVGEGTEQLGARQGLTVKGILQSALAAVIVFDGESNWLGGLALIGLYLIIAASVWWGPVIVA